MQCRKCHTENPDSSNYCARCGTPLIRRKPVRQKNNAWPWIFAGALIIIMGIYLTYDYVLSGRGKASGKIDPHSQSPVVGSLGEGPGSEYIPVGWVIVRNQLDEEVSRIEAVVANGSWIALPAFACFGGERWTFRYGDGDEIAIEAGIWSKGEPVGLWQLKRGISDDSPDLHPWRRNIPLEWSAINSDEPIKKIRMISPQKKGLFLSCALLEGMKKPGVFTQENRIVGWTFGRWQENGILWSGLAGEKLEAGIRVNDFYNYVFANGREVQFSRALAMAEDIPVLDRLDALAQGFRMDPDYLWEDTPLHLRSVSIAGVMHSLSSQLIEDGNTEDVAAILDEQVLLAADYPELLMDTVTAMVKQSNQKRAVQFFKSMKERMYENQRNKLPQLEKFHSQLYKDWIWKAIEQSSPLTGWQAFNEGKELFPDDMDLHLLGVELAAMDNNWMKAEELLNMHDYPQSLRDRTKSLEALIAERRSEEGKIIIRFTPGAKLIPVEALLNRSVTQNFVIDTGASMVTIPSQTAEALGIKLDDNTPVVPVSTASDVALAFEVTIDSIEIKGLRVNNLKALIIDMPGDLGLGLLGLSFLENFHVEIDNTKGILKLKPR